MAQYISFGDGRDGNVSAASGTVNTYATTTATAGTRVVNTSLSVSVGDLVWLMQMQNGDYGANECVIVAGVDTGKFYTLKPLENNYISGAQAIRVPQYIADADFNNTISAQDYNWSTGGVAIIAVNGRFDGTGTFNLFGQAGSNNRTNGQGKGFTGGAGGGPNPPGNGGLTWTGGGVLGQGYGENAVGTGGGGGFAVSTDNSSNGGGGGSNATAGTNGYGKFSTQNAGKGATLTNPYTYLERIWMGGGGGGGSIDGGGDTGGGGAGGGILIILAPIIDISAMTINAYGGNGGGTGNVPAAGGGGAGGSVLLIGYEIYLGTNRVNVNGGTGGDTSYSGVQGNGGNGGLGRIAAIYRDLIAGSTTPSTNARQDTELFKPTSSLAFIID